LSLEWYATETVQRLPPNQVYNIINNKSKNEGTTSRPPQTRLVELQAAFTYFIETDNEGELVGQYNHGFSPYLKDKVELEGLSRQGYNGRQGHVTGEDDNDPERIGVQLPTKTVPIGVKPINLRRVEVQTALPYKEALQMDDDRSMLRELRSRTRALDARDKETWSNIESIHGRCAVVTCINLQPIPQDDDDDDDNARDTKI
jgi:hypothetical protein